MSQPDPSLLPSTEALVQNSSHISPLMLNGKATALAPQLSVEDGNVEMKNIASTEPVLAGDQDIMQLARLGDIPAIQKLYDAGIFTPLHCDDEGITPLHVRSSKMAFVCVHLTELILVGCHQQPICDV